MPDAHATTPLMKTLSWLAQRTARASDTVLSVLHAELAPLWLEVDTAVLARDEAATKQACRAVMERVARRVAIHASRP